MAFQEPPNCGGVYTKQASAISKKFQHSSMKIEFLLVFSHSCKVVLHVKTKIPFTRTYTIINHISGEYNLLQCFGSPPTEYRQCVYNNLNLLQKLKLK